MPLTVAQSPAGVNSAVDSGAVTTPAANRVIADSGALASSNNETATYVVDVTTFITGTAEPALTNMLINVGGSADGSSIVTGGITLGKLHSSSQFVQKRIRVNVSNGQHIYIVAGNTTPTTGSIYNASLTAARCYNKYTDV